MKRKEAATLLASGLAITTGILSPPVAAGAATLIAPEILTEGLKTLGALGIELSAEAFQKYIINADPSEEVLKNGDLTRAIGRAVFEVCGQLANESDDSVDKNSLRQLANTPLEKWEALIIGGAYEEGYGLSFSDIDLADISSKKSVQFVHAKAEDLDNIRALTPEAWQGIIDELCKRESYSIQKFAKAKLSTKLHCEFSRALRKVLIADFAKDGRAYASMQFRIFGEMLGYLNQIYIVSKENRELNKSAQEGVERLSKQIHWINHTAPAHYSVENPQDWQSIFDDFCSLTRTTNATHRNTREIEKTQAEHTFKLDNIDKGVRHLLDRDTKNAQENPVYHIPISLDVPPSQSRFIGRAKELAELESLLNSSNAVTIEGFSGVGKTSLALSLASRWIENGRLDPLGLFYFDCSQRNMRLGVASEYLLRNLATFLANAGRKDAAELVKNERAPLDQRQNTLSETLRSGRFLLFLDNFQDALDETKRIASQPLADLLLSLLTRSLGHSRFVCASYVQCSWSSRLSVQPFHLKPLSVRDARALLLSLGIENIELADRAAGLVGRHPQAIRWFSVLPRELGLSVEEVIDDLTNHVASGVTDVEFDRRIEDELLMRLWDTLPEGTGHFLSLCTVFRRPVPFSALSSLATSPDLYRYRQILIDRFLIEATTREGQHSLHHIVRKFAAKHLNRGPSAWREEAHRKAADWWQMTAARGQPIDRGSLEALIEAHYHLVSAGADDEAESLAERLRPTLYLAGQHSYRQGLLEENESTNRALVQMAPDDPRAHLYLAGALSRRGKRARKEAELHFCRALELDPDLSRARSRYAHFLATQQRDEEAERQFLLSIDSDPTDGRNPASYAGFLEKRQRFKDAEEQFRIGLEMSPTDSRLLASYAKFLSHRDLPDQAEKQFERALEIGRPNARVLDLYATFLIGQKRFTKAKACLAQAVELDPTNLHLRREYAKILFRMDDTEEAGSQMQTLLEVRTLDTRVRSSILNIFLHYAPSHIVDEEVVRELKNQPNPQIHTNYIKYLISRGRLDDAEKQCRAALKSHPDSAAFHVYYGNVLGKLGRLEQAEQEFVTAIDLQPTGLKPRRQYIKFLAAHRHLDQARVQLQELLEISPLSSTTKKLVDFVEHSSLEDNPIDSQESAELMLLRRELFDFSLSALDRLTAGRAILMIKPDDFQAHYCLGRTFMEQLKDLSAAETYLARAVNLRPTSTSARLYYGQVLERQGRYEEALTELFKVDNSLGSNPEMHNSRGNCLKELGQLAEAEKAYRHAIESSNGKRTAKYLNNLALLFLIWPDTSRLSEGLELCRRVAVHFPEFQWRAKTQLQIEKRIGEAPKSQT